jgi:TonB family protein
MSNPHFPLKIMNTKPEVTEEDVHRLMNFDSILQQVNRYNLRQKKIRERVKTFLYTSATLTIAGVGYFYFFLNTPKKPESKEAIAVVKSSHDTARIQKTLPRQKSIPEKEIKKAASTVAIAKPARKIPMDKTVVTTSPYVPAEPREGFPALYDYFNQELKYPAEAIPDSVHGVVTVRFMVTAAGQANQFTILNSLNPACDKEALRVMGKMPSWKPATLDGKAVDSKITVPLTFSLKIIRK